jgi:DNA-binding response OmpR family regulator
LLLAEDNEALRHFIAQTLSPQYDVLEAVDGQAAVEMAFERIPDIIVTDLMMPQLDGFGLLEKLKNDVRTSHIPILMLTAKTAVQHRVEGLQHGADAYLGKPFQTALLLAWLDNLLTSRRRLQRKYVRLQEPQPPVATSDMEAKNQDVALGVLDRQFLERFQEILTLEIDNDAITPEELARRMNMSRSQLHRKLTAVTGLSATEFLRNFRLDRAYELLQQGAGNVSEVAFLVGFVNAKHFSTSFKERFGKSPSEV